MEQLKTIFYYLIILGVIILLAFWANYLTTQKLDPITNERVVEKVVEKIVPVEVIRTIVIEKPCPPVHTVN